MPEAPAKQPYDEAAITQWCAARGLAVRVLAPIGDGALNFHWLLATEDRDERLVFRQRGAGHWLDRGFVGEGLALTLAGQAGLTVPEVRVANADAMVMECLPGSADREGVLACAAGSPLFKDSVCEQLRALRAQTARAFDSQTGGNAWLARVIETYCLADTPWFQHLDAPHRARAIMEAVREQGFARLCLNHGDFRTGNLLFDGNALTGVLDWEFSAFRPEEADVGWMLSSPWRYSRPDLEASGLMSRDELLGSLEQADCPRLWAWEALALARWAVIARLQDARQGLPSGSNADEAALLDEAEAILRR